MKIKSGLSELNTKPYSDDLGILPKWLKECDSNNYGEIKKRTDDSSAHSNLYRLSRLLAIVFPPILDAQRTQNV